MADWLCDDCADANDKYLDCVVAVKTEHHVLECEKCGNIVGVLYKPKEEEDEQ